MRNFTLMLIIALLVSCNQRSPKSESRNVRPVVDTVGFAHLDWQMDSIVNRISRLQAAEFERAKVAPEIAWRVAICPHDDYSYVGWHYPAILQNIKAKTLIIFGVAHKAKQFNLADRLAFDSFTHWQGAYGDIKVSSLRDKLIEALPQEAYTIHDSMHRVEHSIESMLPFLQHYNRNVEIVPILIPYMSFETMQTIAKQLAQALSRAMDSSSLGWGSDIALLITTDAVHYGNEEWGGKNYAPFGVDSIGYSQAVEHEHEIIQNCLQGEVSSSRIQKFFEFTVSPNDYREYRWTWCGRYSVPFGLLTALNINELTGTKPLIGHVVGYSTSIDHKPIPVEDLMMGRTAIASPGHWVGYASVGYE